MNWSENCMFKSLIQFQWFESNWKSYVFTHWFVVMPHTITYHLLMEINLEYGMDK